MMFSVTTLIGALRTSISPCSNELLIDAIQSGDFYGITTFELLSFLNSISTFYMLDINILLECLPFPKSITNIIRIYLSSDFQDDNKDDAIFGIAYYAKLYDKVVTIPLRLLIKNLQENNLIPNELRVMIAKEKKIHIRGKEERDFIFFGNDDFENFIPIPDIPEHNKIPDNPFILFTISKNDDKTNKAIKYKYTTQIIIEDISSTLEYIIQKFPSSIKERKKKYLRIQGMIIKTTQPQLYKIINLINHYKFHNYNIDRIKKQIVSITIEEQKE